MSSRFYCQEGDPELTLVTGAADVNYWILEKIGVE